MALKFKIDESSFNDLDDGVKSLYEKKGDVYMLGVEGLPEPEDVSGLKSKVDQLLAEKKAAQRAKEEAEAEAAARIREQAEKDNNFEALFKSSESEREKLANDLNSLKAGIKQEKVNTAAMQLAAQMADKQNAELLATFIRPRLDLVDGDLKILDGNGQLTVGTTEDLMKEFAASGKYDSLLRGNQAGGGGAVSDNRGGAATKEVSRAEFDRMPSNQRMEHVKSGGKITDE